LSTEYSTLQYTFFSAAHGTFSKIDSILRNKKSQEIQENSNNPCILSDHNAIKLEFNNKSASIKYSNNWKMNNTLLNSQWVKEEIWEKIRKFLGFN
jgi:hypothetical protein